MNVHKENGEVWEMYAPLEENLGCWRKGVYFTKEVAQHLLERKRLKEWCDQVDGWMDRMRDIALEGKRNCVNELDWKVFSHDEEFLNSLGTKEDEGIYLLCRIATGRVRSVQDVRAEALQILVDRNYVVIQGDVPVCTEEARSVNLFRVW